MTINDILYESLTHPVKSRIITTLQIKGECTVKEILKSNPYVAQATMYRNIKKLVEDKIIIVVSENHVRAVVEKVYGLSNIFSDVNENIISTNNKELFFNYYSKFSLELLAKFKEYTDDISTDLKNRDAGFSSVPIYASNDDLQEISIQIQKVLEGYLHKKSNEKKEHNIAMIITPSSK